MQLLHPKSLSRFTTGPYSTLSLRHQNHTLLLLSIHLDHHRFLKADMTKIFRFFHRRLRIEEVLIIHTIIHKGIDSEISNPERSQILKEMCSLTGIYPIVGQSGFHNHTGSRDMRPLHRNTEPCITASPTSRTDKHIILSFIQELLVDLFYLPSNCLIVRGTIIIGFT